MSAYNCQSLVWMSVLLTTALAVIFFGVFTIPPVSREIIAKRYGIDPKDVKLYQRVFATGIFYHF
jgi:hypothetical protein